MTNICLSVFGGDLPSLRPLLGLSGHSLINPVFGPVSRDNETTHLAAADRMKVASLFYVGSRGELTR